MIGQKEHSIIYWTNQRGCTVIVSCHIIRCNILSKPYINWPDDWTSYYNNFVYKLNPTLSSWLIVGKINHAKSVYFIPQVWSWKSVIRRWSAFQIIYANVDYLNHTTLSHHAIQQCLWDVHDWSVKGQHPMTDVSKVISKTHTCFE